MQNAFPRTRVAMSLLGVAAMFTVPLAHGSGFALQENSASGLGNAFAGGAAAAEDAGTVWTNPAGMSRFTQREALQAIHVIIPSNKFSNDGSVPALNQPLGGNAVMRGLQLHPQPFRRGALQPAVCVRPGRERPFGLTTEYDDGERRYPGSSRR